MIGKPGCNSLAGDLSQTWSQHLISPLCLLHFTTHCTTHQVNVSKCLIKSMIPSNSKILLYSNESRIVFYVKLCRRGHSYNIMLTFNDIVKFRWRSDHSVFRRKSYIRHIFEDGCNINNACFGFATCKMNFG